MTALKVSPVWVKPGGLLNVDVTAGLPGAKWQLRTVDNLCIVAGTTTNTGRLRLDGTLYTALKAPTRLGTAAVELLLDGKLIAHESVTVAK